MQPGSANDKQTKLNFAPKNSHNDNSKNPQPTPKGGSDHSNNNTIEGNRHKRNRVEFENQDADNNNLLKVPQFDIQNSDSNSSLLSTGSTGSINNQKPLRALQRGIGGSQRRPRKQQLLRYLLGCGAQTTSHQIGTTT